MQAVVFLHSNLLRFLCKFKENLHWFPYVLRENESVVKTLCALELGRSAFEFHCNHLFFSVLMDSLSLSFLIYNMKINPPMCLCQELGFAR